MRRKTLLNRNVIIVLMLFIFLLTAFISTAYSLWYFPDSGSSKTVDTDIYQDDIDENFKALLNEKDTYGSYLKIIDCRDGVIPDYYTDFAMQSGLLDNSENFTDNGNIFRGKNKNYKKKVFGVSSLCHKDNESYKYPKNPKGEYDLGSFVSSVFYGSGTSMTEIYLYDLLNSQYKLVDHLTHESIELINRNGTSSDGGELDAESYSSTKSDDYREKIGYPFSKSRILFLVPRNTELIKNKQSETPKVVSGYNIYFHNEATGDYDYYRELDYVWLWNDRTDFGVSLPLNCSDTIDGKSYKSLHIDYKTLYKACNDFKDTTNESGFIMTSQTAPTGIIFKTEDGTKFAPKDKDKKFEDYKTIENLALPLPPNNSTSFNIYINADSQGKFTISTNQDVDLTKNKNIVYYSTNGLDHLYTWSSSTTGVGRWISSNYVYNFNMAGCNKTVSCFSYNYGEKFNFYKNWNGPADGSPQFSPGFTFDKNEAGEKINYNYDNLILVNYKAENKTGDIDISDLFSGTSECTSIYLIEDNKYENGVKVCPSRSDFITALNQLN